jgi:alpha-1,2-mannosyltransferase
MISMPSLRVSGDTDMLQFIDSSVNTFFYRKWQVVSWNIVKYNVFSNSGGPNLYGTEPWTFYFKNLALNFNVWFVFALLALPLFILQKLVAPSKQGFQSGLRTIVFLSPFYMWLGIFTLQPHKEERFMYPAYPLLALNAAMGLHIVLSAFGHANPKTLVGMIPARLKLFVVTLALILAVDVSIARIYGIYSAYSAPMSLYKPLGAGVRGEDGVGAPGDFVCLGKEWYRFPTSYFLPRNMRAKFIRSEFRGLLPGQFSEARTGFGFWGGTWLMPSGMNDRNEEDMGKYTDLRTCAFLVDTQYPEHEKRGLSLPPNEPDYIADFENWDQVQCVSFLDASSTHTLARALWVPNWDLIPEKYQRKWGRHCLLRRRK